MRRQQRRTGTKASAAEAFPSGGSSAGSGASDLTAGWITLLSGLFISGFLYWRNHAHTVAAPDMRFHEFNMLNTAFILGVPLFILMVFLRREPAEFGLTVGDSGKGNLISLLLFALFIPAILFVAPRPEFQRYYLGWMNESRALQELYWTGRHYSGGRIHWPDLVYHEVIMAFYMFGWEWYHRGFLLYGLKRIMPVWGAVLFQAVLFGALHVGKPWVEVASSFAGGILLGMMALRFRSFLPCFVVHFLVSAFNDLAVLYFFLRH